MSGGVDSSTAAVLLKQQGHDIVGITMKLYEGEIEEPCGKKMCCTAKDVLDAKQIAYQHDFPHIVTNAATLFSERIISYFIQEYSQGCTPNPCILCNRYLKFDYLWQYARMLDCDHLATGHYARLVQQDGQYFIAKARDSNKDQSYFLSALPVDILPHILFPLGELTKQEVRAYAQNWGLITARKADSQNVCFLNGADYRTFVQEHLPNPPLPGNIVNKQGKILGQHGGYFHYTIGQRKGLGIAYREPLYVIRIDPDKNEVVVGTQEEALFTEFAAALPNIFDAHYLDGQHTLEIVPWYRAQPVMGTVSLKDQRLHVNLQTPKRGISPGQSVVAYHGDIIVCSGVITRD